MTMWKSTQQGDTQPDQAMVFYNMLLFKAANSGDFMSEAENGKAKDYNTIFNRISHNLKHYSPRNKVF